MKTKHKQTDIVSRDDCTGIDRKSSVFPVRADKEHFTYFVLKSNENEGVSQFLTGSLLCPVTFGPEVV